jgi:hypothetical protein
MKRITENQEQLARFAKAMFEYFFSDIKETEMKCSK